MFNSRGFGGLVQEVQEVEMGVSGKECLEIALPVQAAGHLLGAGQGEDS